MWVLFSNRFKRHNTLTRLKGQMVVEYVLLLIVSIFVATLLVNLMVSRSADSPGFIIQKWKQLIEFVAEDTPDDV